MDTWDKCRTDEYILKLISDEINEVTDILNNKPKYITSKDYTKLCMLLINTLSDLKTILYKFKNNDITSHNKDEYIKSNMMLLLTYAPFVFESIYNKQDIKN